MPEAETQRPGIESGRREVEPERTTAEAQRPERDRARDRARDRDRDRQRDRDRER